ncbi:sensor domain-containing diguanylate cyclase [Spirillospora albida]|uniref:sensor domain-containing diguanylate cyclase n=1 Tax=Spirillospora albida TaxID=58123 RepID=UPI0004C226D9|nr:sensor domain-containing diguanylate cyclase [Spirillospora albida]
MLFARASSARPRNGRRPGGRFHWPAVGAWALLVAGLAGSAGTAVFARDTVTALERQRYDKTVADIMTSTTLTLRRNTDFMVALSATFSADPDMTNRTFSQWMNTTEASRRYSGGVGYGYVQLVPAARVPEFQRTLRADPRLPVTYASLDVAITPSGKRPFYCLARLAVMVGDALPFAALPAGYDYCGPDIVSGITGFDPLPAAELYRGIGDAGTIVPRILDSRSGLLGMAMPVYESGTPPVIINARRAALRGLAVGTFNIREVLAEGLGDRKGLKLELLHQTKMDAAPVPVTALGTAPQGSTVHETVIDAGTSWTIRITGRPIGGISGAATFWGTLTVGVLLTVLVQLLARSRRRALRLVERRTEELRRQASHDALTGLPNRALITERIEESLERHRREGGEPAVMFLDLDGFKQVNDTLGHAVGDRLLRAVAGRLSGLLREGGSVGRLGGDEFVILVEDVLDGAAEQVASRICAALEQPFRLDDTDPLVVHSRASIGIAVGLRVSAEALIHDADTALYEVKQSGKGHYKVFAPSR